MNVQLSDRVQVRRIRVSKGPLNCSPNMSHDDLSFARELVRVVDSVKASPFVIAFCTDRKIEKLKSCRGA